MRAARTSLYHWVRSSTLSASAAFKADTPLNKLTMDKAELFKKAVKLDKPQPSPNEVQANKKKWGL